jgi:hypothetical protein
MTGSQPLPEVSTGDKTATAKLQAGAPGGECLVKIGGDWRLNERVPSWNSVFQNHMAMNVRVVPDDLGKWDTSLLLFLVHGRVVCGIETRFSCRERCLKICRHCCDRLRMWTRESQPVKRR